MVGATQNLSPSERRDVAAAVAAARARTQAQFALVIVRQSDHYAFYPFVWGATLALVAGGCIALAYPHLDLRLAIIMQSVILAVIALALSSTPLRMLSVPPAAKHLHAHAMAHRDRRKRIMTRSGLMMERC